MLEIVIIGVRRLFLQEGPLKKSEPKILVLKTNSIIKYFKFYKLFI
jgi:hypothetical protein